MTEIAGVNSFSKHKKSGTLSARIKFKIFFCYIYSFTAETLFLRLYINMKEILKFDDESLTYEDKIDETALKSFGIKYIFPWQRMVISNILDAAENSVSGVKEENLKDSINRQIVLLPTGAGKSLCFQVPALLLPGKTLVIYPLLALMKDQKRRMDDGKIKNVMIQGGQSQEERLKIFEELKNDAKIIIANPEVLNENSVLNELKKIHLSHIAIDEAHCVSEWGDTFRPSYLNLEKILKELNADVVTAFTATASPEVLTRISEILFSGSAHIVKSESDRPNIHYYVKYAAAKQQKVLTLCATEEKPMIVFCGTRKKAEQMSRMLNFVYGNDFSKFYHAGLEKSEKTKIENWFFTSKDKVLCATCAYGMGVDKKDIHTTVHLDVPLTAEAYIQEAGRGGRDGSVSNAILLWNNEDRIKFNAFPEKSRNRAMKNFAETKKCRREVLLNFLDAEQAVCSGCDLCNKRFNLENKGINDDLKFSDWQAALKIAEKNERTFTPLQFINKIEEELNSLSTKHFSRRIYDYDSCVEIYSELIKTKKIKHCKNLWKGKIETKTVREQIIHDLHHLKRNVFRLRWKIQKNLKKSFQVS